MTRSIPTEPIAETAPDSIPGKMSYEDFLIWADGRHAEWVDGEVILMSPVSQRHQLLVKFLLKLLDEFVEAHDLGIVLFAPFQMKLRPARAGREPDVLFLAREHLDRLTENYLNGPADLAIEIISPESRERDSVIKLEEYARAGIGEYWLLDPHRQEAAFYQLGANGVYVPASVDTDGFYHSRVLNGLRLRVSWLWQDPLPSLRSVREALGWT